MVSKREAFFLLAAASFLCPSCGSDRISPVTMEQIRQSHLRMLTVDSRVNAASYIMRPDWNIGERHGSRKPKASRFDLPRMKEGGLDAAFFVIPVPRADSAPANAGEPRETILRSIGRIKRIMEGHPGQIGLGSSPEDAYRHEKEGRLTAYIGLDDGRAIGADLSLIAAYHAEGVRYLTLCGESDNDICDSATDEAGPEDRGLSDFGRRVVAECNRVGMIIDLAHCSEKSFFDVLAASRAPVIVSHAAARALCDRPENLTAGMIRALAEKRGVVQVCMVPELLIGTRPAKGVGVPDFADHIDHIIRIAGVGGVGIGSDFCGGGGVAGCEDVSGILNLTVELLRRGYDELSVEMIWSNNIMRVFKDVIRIADTR